MGIRAHLQKQRLHRSGWGNRRGVALASVVDRPRSVVVVMVGAVGRASGERREGRRESSSAVRCCVHALLRPPPLPPLSPPPRLPLLLPPLPM